LVAPEFVSGGLDEGCVDFDQHLTFFLCQYEASLQAMAEVGRPLELDRLLAGFGAE
jgi:hypothetical protein